VEHGLNHTGLPPGPLHEVARRKRRLDELLVLHHPGNLQSLVCNNRAPAVILTCPPIWPTSSAI